MKWTINFFSISEELLDHVCEETNRLTILTSVTNEKDVFWTELRVHEIFWTTDLFFCILGVVNTFWLIHPSSIKMQEKIKEGGGFPSRKKSQV